MKNFIFSNLFKILFLFAITLFVLVGCIQNFNSQSEPNLPDQTEISTTVILDEEAYSIVKNRQISLISEIQGKSHASPFSRQTVSNVFGVVTVKRADGFYMQTVFPDEKDETSEGIFIFVNNVPKVKIGDWVLVTGEVSEFFPGDVETGNLSITEIESNSIRVISSDNPLPDPIILGNGGRKLPTEIIDDDKKTIFDMNDGLDFFESLESMLVQINDPVCVGPSSSYKEFAVLADGGKAATGNNLRGGITISENDFNPERILIDDSLISIPLVDVGDYFTAPIIGVVDYSFGNFKVQPIKKLELEKGDLETEQTENNAPNLLTVASINLENLDPNDSQSRFEQLADIIINNLNSPTIISFQEVQDNNGSLNDSEVDASKTYTKIIDAIKNADGPTYKYVDINPIDDKDGGEVGGNIRVGFLIKDISNIEYAIIDPKEAREEVSYSYQSGEINLSSNPGRIDPMNFVFNDSRKSLIFEFVYNKSRIFIINNHWNSKGEDTPLFGSSQPPLLKSENQRSGQARAIGGFVQDMILIDPEINLIVLGDLNDFYFSKPVKLLENSGLINLIFDLPIYERYTYNYEGNSQNLDNLLISPNLKKSVVNFDIIHINSEFSYLERFSDHDPLLVTLEIGTSW